MISRRLRRLLCGILFASALVLIALHLSRKSARKEPESARETVFTDMMTRIQTLMEEKELLVHIGKQKY